jgi:hypothetical protein
MAISHQITSTSDVEAFTVGYDPDGNPIQKPVAEMTVAEQCSALAIAKQEMDETARDAEYLLPLAGRTTCQPTSR